jgi:hypothetical protein
MIVDTRQALGGEADVLRAGHRQTDLRFGGDAAGLCHDVSSALLAIRPYRSESR